MDGLADFSSAGSSLLWLWIIEYLASFKEVDTSILHDLIETAPEIPDDLAKVTREMVALRCLEDLFGSSDKVNNDGLSCTENKVGFALSESCEDVLQQILQETSASDLNIAGPELLKWDVHPFIMHKRALMPKCALQHLKDTILEGTHPLAASLKESSGLTCVSECGTARVGDLDHNALAMSEKENLLPSTCENRDGQPRDNLHIRNMLPFKRSRGDMATRDMAAHTNGVQEKCDLNYNAKKHKQDAISNHQSADQISVPTCGKEMVEPLSGRDVAVAGREGSHFSNQSQDAGLEESQFPDDGCDNCDDLRRLGQNGDVNDDQIQHNQAEDGHNAARLPRAEPVQNATVDEANITECVPSVGTQHEDTEDESRGEVEHSCEEETLSDNDAYHNDRIDVAVKKSHFLSSQAALGHDSLATSGWTEQNLCVKCNKDGQLLSCSSSTCPLAVHENCLGFPVKFDEKGNFHCPFCAYTLSISEYLEAKKRASVARKELAAFMQMGSVCHQMDLANKLHSKDPGHSGSNGDKDIHENGNVGEQENNQENQNGQHLHDVSDQLCQKHRAKKKKAEPLHDVSDPLCQRHSANKKKAETSASCVNANSPCREEEANAFSGRDCISNGDKVVEENMDNYCPSERGLEGQPERTPPECGKLACTNTYVEPMDDTEAEAKLQKEDVQPASSESSDPPESPVIALNIDEEEISESEDDKFIISNYSIRFRRPKTHYTYPPIPQLRRKKVPWTAKEEEILKKGVQKFASVDDRIIPWKKILEFGSSVFFGGRTAIDLKDKWRNMCKGSPRSK